MKIHDGKHRLDVHTADISGSVFHDVNMSGATFDDVNMNGWIVHNVNLSGLRLDEANLAGAKIMNADLRHVALVQCHVDGMTINGVAIEDLMSAYDGQKSEPNT